MSRYRVTCVWSVAAPNRALARMRVSEAVRVGVAHGVELEFESVQLVLDRRDRPGWQAWLEEARDQLLGPRQDHQQPAGKKSSS